MIRRIASTALALASLPLWFAGACPKAQAAATPAPLREGARHAGRSLQVMYASINASAVEVYLAGALLDPSRAVGDVQVCLRSDNALSTMASPLAAPPYSQSSIEQRVSLVEAIAAHAGAVAALAGDAAPAEVASALGDLAKALSRLKKSAGVHREHDLAIAGPVAVLAASDGVLELEQPRGPALERAVRAGQPTIDALIDVLAQDVSARHAEALAAAASAYASWLAAYDRVRLPALAASAQGARAPVFVPRCAAPETAQTPAQSLALNAPGRASAAAAPSVASPKIDAEAAAAALGVRLALLDHVNAARERQRALENADPASAIAALRAVDAALLRFVEAPGDAAAGAALAAAIGAFRGEAESAYDAYRAGPALPGTR